MGYPAIPDSPDLLGWWIRQPNTRRRPRLRPFPTAASAGLRFAFYRRMSTKEFQGTGDRAGKASGWTATVWLPAG
jgi:hypothetical protein